MSVARAITDTSRGTEAPYTFSNVEQLMVDF